MGPTALFDKSFLQSLSVDEAMWFDYYFIANVCPLFYVETLADLEKDISGRSPEDEVRIIADKTPVLHGHPSAYHLMMVGSDLNGRTPPMTGQIPVAGGRLVQHEGKSGVVFSESDEAKAFRRWQEREFKELERELAKKWRSALREMDLASAAAAIRPFGIDGKTCPSLDVAKQIADSLIDGPDRPIDRFRFALSLLGVQAQTIDQIVLEWSLNLFPPLRAIAPYARHVAGVEAFMLVALAARLISDQRASNRTDIAYLFYLPFCMVFVSSDRLHQRCAPHFMRQDQQFVWGPDLKKDLGSIDQHFRSLPEDVKEKGIMAFARNPPEGSLVHQIWSRHFPGWESEQESGQSDTTERDREADKRIIDKLKAFENAPAVNPQMVPNTNDLDMVSIERRLSKRRGSWWQLPKDLKEDS